jgi:hypothetical protein
LILSLETSVDGSESENRTFKLFRRGEVIGDGWSFVASAVIENHGEEDRVYLYEEVKP